MYDAGGKAWNHSGKGTKFIARKSKSKPVYRDNEKDQEWKIDFMSNLMGSVCLERCIEKGWEARVSGKSTEMVSDAAPGPG